MKQYAVLIVGLTVCAAHATPPATWQEPATGMNFVAIPKGCFKMGTEKHVPLKPDVYWDRIRHHSPISADEKPNHEVCVDAFWMGKFEVRSSEWQHVMGTPAPDKPDLPANFVSHPEAREFAERLTRLSGGKYRFRLPTEAEWEYACRAGTENEVTPIGSELVGKSWYGGRGAYRPQPSESGKLAANAFGLHDMLGNVWEWTEDNYLPDAYARHTLYNPKMVAPGTQFVIRGGSFRTEPRQVRCAGRGHYDATERLDSIGFRLVREAEDGKSATKPVK